MAGGAVSVFLTPPILLLGGAVAMPYQPPRLEQHGSIGGILGSLRLILLPDGPFSGAVGLHGFLVDPGHLTVPFLGVGDLDGVLLLDLAGVLKLGVDPVLS